MDMINISDWFVAKGFSEKVIEEKYD